MKKTSAAFLVKTVRAAAESAFGFLEMIDRLRDMGIMTYPRFSKGGTLTSLRFGTPGRTLTSGQVGINQLMQTGPIYRSVSLHYPVLEEIQGLVDQGLPQPRILDQAREVMILRDRPADKEPVRISPSIYNRIDRVNEAPETAIRLCAGFDHFTNLDRDTLNFMTKDARNDLETYQIAGMNDDHARSALRWILRGMTAEAAIARQRQIMAHDQANRRPPADHTANCASVLFAGNFPCNCMLGD